jgi:nucleotide-binding universal stress UspA family protein
MEKRLLVPLDGSTLADRILLAAEPLIVQDDTEVTLLRVVTDGDVDKARSHLEARRDELSRRGARRVRVEAVPGTDPAEAILAFAKEYGPSLIVTSTHGRSSSLRWTRGSVAERLLERSEHPLFLASPVSLNASAVTRPLPMRRILVPLDASRWGERILPLVANVARAYGSEIVLLHVLEPGNAAGGKRPTIEEIEAVLRAHEGKHFEHLKVRTLVHEGNPAAVILDTVGEDHPDLVALTTHGKSERSNWLFGSVASQVLRQCTCPLLVLRTTRPVA